MPAFAGMTAKEIVPNFLVELPPPALRLHSRAFAGDGFEGKRFAGAH